MATIVAHFESAIDTPLVSPANVPTIRIRRTDTGALVVTNQAMTETGDGNYRYDYTTVDGLEYSIRVDGDPTAAGQTVAGGRYAYGATSGTEEARLETDIPAILATSQLDVRQGWTRATASGSAMRAIIHLEQNGDLVALPVTAEVALEAKDRAGTVIAVFTQSGIVAGAKGYFSTTLSYIPVFGEVITVQATVTLSGVGSGTHVGRTQIAFPEF